MAQEDAKEYSGVKQTKGPVEKDLDRNEHVKREYEIIKRGTGSPNDKLIAEFERQREEIRALREEVRFLREGLLQLLANQMERQWEELNALREMQQHQYNFMQEMLNREQEVRLDNMRRDDDRNWEREKERERDGDEIEMMLKRDQEEVERNPGDPELRVHLGHLLWRVENIEGAYRQFKAALEIAPDFEEAFGSLERLRMEFPDVSRIPVEKPLEDSAGTVISANKEEIKLQIFGSDAVETFKVPFVQNEEGEWLLNEDFAHFAGSLEPGMRIKILWQKTEDRRIIHKIERLEDEE
jgi:tetratricopeptide (TPR) repeat protein